MMRDDMISAFIRQLTEFLGASHPIRLAVAVALGISSLGIIKICVPIFSHPSMVTAAQLSAVYYVAFWIVLIFAPLAFGKGGAPEGAANFVRELRLMIAQTDFSVPVQRAIWREVIRKYLESAQPSFSRKISARSLFEQAKTNVEEQVNDGVRYDLSNSPP